MRQKELFVGGNTNVELAPILLGLLERRAEPSRADDNGDDRDRARLAPYPAPAIHGLSNGRKKDTAPTHRPTSINPEHDEARSAGQPRNLLHPRRAESVSIPGVPKGMHQVQRARASIVEAL